MRHLLLIIIFTAGCGSGNEAIELYKSGMKEYNNRKLVEAEKFFTAALDEDNDLLNAYLMLGKISYFNGNYAESVRYTNTLLDKNPEHAPALYWKARSLVMLKRDDTAEAENLLKKSLELDGHNSQARLLLGMICEKNSKYREALYQYSLVKEEEDEIISARGNLAMLYTRMGLKQKGEAELSSAEKLSEICGKGADRLKTIRREIGGMK